MSEKELPSFAEVEDPQGQTSHLEKANTTTSTSIDQDDEKFKFTFGKFIALYGLILGFSADIIILSAVSAVLSTINKDIGPSKAYVWIISASYATVSITSPFVGRFGDIFGRRNLLILGNIISIIGNLVSALAKNIITIVVGSVLIGLASSMHQLAWSCISEIVPRKHRPLAIGFLEGSISVPSILGPLVGFMLIEHTHLGWRNIFWIALAINGASLLLIALFYHPVNQYVAEEGKTKSQQVKSLDYVGFVLFAIGLCLFLVGLSFGGTQFPWKSAGTLAPLLIGILFLIFTGLWEKFTFNPYNQFPHTVMKNYRGFLIVCGVSFLGGMLYYSTLILWPLQIETFYATDPVKVGLYSMAFSGGGMIGAFASASILERVDQARWILTCICSLATVLCGAQAIVGINTHIASTILVVMTGFIISCATVVSNAMLQLAVPHQYLGVAMGLVTTTRNVGGTIGSTVYTIILSNQLTTHLGTNIATALAKAGLPLADIAGVTGALATGNSMSPALASASPAALGAGILALKLTYVHSFRLIYLISITFGVLGTICAAFTRNVGEYMTNKIDVTISDGAHFGFHDFHEGGHVINHTGEEIVVSRAKAGAQIV